MPFDNCADCIFWAKPECKRYPPTINGYPTSSRGCGEYKKEEVILCLVEAKAEEKEPQKAEAQREESPREESPKAVSSFTFIRRGPGRPPKSK